MNTYTSSFFLPGYKGLNLIANGYENMFLKSKYEREYNFLKKRREGEDLSKNTFCTHDNGGTPYLVYKKDNSHIIVLRNPHRDYDIDQTDDELKLLYTEIVVEYKNVKRFMPGICNEEENIGNSILLELEDGKYIHIGIEIYSFTLPENDTITKYYSLIGNNDVPYPVALGEINAYFMLDNIVIDKTHFPEYIGWEDAYMYFYGHQGAPLQGNNRQMKGDHFENMKYIHYRDW